MRHGIFLSLAFPSNIFPSLAFSPMPTDFLFIQTAFILKTTRAEFHYGFLA